MIAPKIFVVTIVTAMLVYKISHIDPLKIVSFIMVNLMDYDFTTYTEPILHKEYDFIVIGGGTAGCVLANRLSENTNWTVLLLEAGGNEHAIMDVPLFVFFTQQSNKLNWKYKTAPSDSYCLAFKDNQCNWPRGKVMGGTSVLNYMIYTRGNKIDFDSWADMGATGWSNDEVVPYFEKLEDLSNIGNFSAPGPLSISNLNYRSQISNSFIESFQELGLPHTELNKEHQAGVSYVKVTAKKGARFSSNRAYIEPIRNRKNLHIKNFSFVTKLHIDEMTKVVKRVEYRDKSNAIHSVHVKKEVILSAGAVSSPQILMLSGIGALAHLQQHNISPIIDLPAVGKNLMDHVMSGVLLFTSNITTHFKYEAEKLPNWLKYVSKGEGVMTVPGAFEALSFISTDNLTNINGTPDSEVFLVSAAFYDTDATLSISNMKPESFTRMFGSLKDNNIRTFTISSFVLRPKSRGTIELVSNDPRAHPSITPNYFADQYDVNVGIKSIRTIMELQNTEAFKRINATFVKPNILECDQFEELSDEYWNCFMRHFSYTIYHPSGTCKMGAQNDKTAVVDPRLRVIGLQNLRVADASVMPVIVSGHPSAAVYMIAEKAGEMIKEDWLS